MRVLPGPGPVEAFSIGGELSLDGRSLNATPVVIELPPLQPWRGFNETTVLTVQGSGTLVLLSNATGIALQVNTPRAPGPSEPGATQPTTSPSRPPPDVPGRAHPGSLGNTSTGSAPPQLNASQAGHQEDRVLQAPAERSPPAAPHGAGSPRSTAEEAHGDGLPGPVPSLVVLGAVLAAGWYTLRGDPTRTREAEASREPSPRPLISRNPWER